jgi:hypothetical protein
VPKAFEESTTCTDSAHPTVEQALSSSLASVDAGTPIRTGVFR